MPWINVKPYDYYKNGENSKTDVHFFLQNTYQDWYGFLKLQFVDVYNQKYAIKIVARIFLGHSVVHIPNAFLCVHIMMLKVSVLYLPQIKHTITN